jgi:hypothetical protein
VKFYEQWVETNDDREKAMMQKIQNHCVRDTFDKAVFFVGAAHRQAIIQKSREPVLQSTGIKWEFDG